MTKKSHLEQMCDTVLKVAPWRSGDSGSLTRYVYNQASKHCPTPGSTHAERCFKVAGELENGIMKLQKLVKGLQAIGFKGEE